MYDLTAIGEADIKACGEALKAQVSGARNMEAAANRIVDHLYDNLRDGPSGGNACVLARFYKVHPYGGLQADQQVFARGVLGGEPDSPDLKCLTLLATRGAEADWNQRRKSNGHQAVPMPSEQAVAGVPMVAQLISRLGLEVSEVLKPDPSIFLELSERTCDVFHVEEAKGSPYIPAQDDFVIPHGVRSVVGFGGVFPDGGMFAVILFSKVAISRAQADLFRALALDVKSAVAPLSAGPVFEDA